MKYLDGNTFASDPVRITIDVERLRFLMPELFGIVQRIKHAFRKWGTSSYIDYLNEHVGYGDSQGAVVMQTSPLLIAAYNEDMDCVVMLRFEDKIQKRYSLKAGDPLICVNTFGRVKTMQSDLLPGPGNSGHWNYVHPIVAEFVSSDYERINQRKKEIGAKGFAYIQELGKAYLIKKPGTWRSGKPFLAGTTEE